MNVSYEYRDEVIRYKHEKVNLCYEPQPTNFRSYFGYTQSTHDLILSQGNTANLKRKEVYCDELLLDVDNPEQLEPVINVLGSLGWNYKQYSTGNRGAHFHVCIEPLMGEHVPYSIKQLLRRVGLYERVDTSPIHPAGQFRQEGATHSKTNKKKTLVYSKEGVTPTIPYLIEPEPELDEYATGSEHDGYMYSYLLLTNVGIGERYKRLYAIMRHGVRAGEDLDSIKQDLIMWNANLDNPHDEKDINKYHEMIARQL